MEGRRTTHLGRGLGGVCDVREKEYEVKQRQSWSRWKHESVME